MLLCFETVLSLKVNLVKSKITLVGVVSDISCLEDLLGYKIADLPLKYLGLFWRLPLRQNPYGMGL